MELKQHVKILAYVHLGMGILIAMMGLMALLFFVGIGIAGFAGQADPELLGILSVVGLVAGIMFAIFAVPSIIAGAGMLKLKGWARILALVMGILNLFSIPIGTAVGIYSLWVLFQDDVEQAFASGTWAEE